MPTFATERLTLRTFTPDDAATLDRYYGKPGVCRYLLHEHWSAAELREEIAKRVRRTGLDGPEEALSVVAEYEGQVVGDIAVWLNNDSGRIAEIGWVFDPAYAGRGFATEAARTIIAHAFATRPIHRLIAQMDARNTASAAVAERLGMVREAHLRQDWWCKGEWTDTVIYALLRDELP